MVPRACANELNLANEITARLHSDTEPRPHTDHRQHENYTASSSRGSMQLAGAVHGQEKAAGDTKLRHKAVGTDNAPEDQASESFGA